MFCHIINRFLTRTRNIVHFGFTLNMLFKYLHTVFCVYTYIQLYCIVSIHLYSASCSAHQSEALPVRETQREESSYTQSYIHTTYIHAYIQTYTYTYLLIHAYTYIPTYMCIILARILIYICRHTLGTYM